MIMIPNLLIPDLKTGEKKKELYQSLHRLHKNTTRKTREKRRSLIKMSLGQRERLFLIPRFQLISCPV